MLFRQIFDSGSGTYTYLLAARRGGEALLIDPVLEKVDQYLTLIRELDLRLVKAVDTHIHADHVTGLGALRDCTRCVTVMGRESGADVVAMRVRDGDAVDIDGVSLEAIYTPGHTDESYSFRMADRVFTGDTLLIRGTGRTDFQNGDPRKQYDSIVNKLFRLPDETLVFPCHDYKGMTVSSIGEEKALNPRLKVRSVEEYVELMNNLKLPNPKMMDVAVPSNRAIGLVQERGVAESWALRAEDAMEEAQKADVLLVDLREGPERFHDADIPGSVHAPYAALADFLRSGGLLSYEATRGGKRLLFYCSYGERSAMAVTQAREAGFARSYSIMGGVEAWLKAGGPVTYADARTQAGA